MSNVYSLHQEQEQLQQNQLIVNQKKYRDILPEGYKLHWYEIRSLLGRGGYGITYLAMDTNLERQVAIKEYLPIDFASRQTDQTVHPLSGEHGEMYQWGLERFLKEARTLAKFNHPNIVRVLSVFEHNNTAYMVMEYEQGEDLAALYKKRAHFAEEELLDTFIPILDGLSLVHREGFIHRDIKPSNIYIRSDQSPVLIDFGSARQSTGQTRTMTSLVTYGYAPFEQYNEGHEKQGPWTDIYSLGASLYFGITKSKPEDALKRGGAILAASADPYLPVSIIAKDRYSENFLLSIDSALRFRAEDRPQEVLAWADMLLGKSPAPPLPEEMKHAKPVEQNLDSTVIMPAGYYEQKQQPTGQSKRNTGRLIDSSGRRATSEHQPVQTGQRTEFTEPPSTGPQPAVATKPVKSHNGAMWILMGLIAVLSIAAIILVLMPVEKTEQQSTETAQGELSTDENPNAEKIATLLQQAKQDFAAKRYVAPEGDNAAQRYLKVLELDQDNKQAAAGLEKITQYYADLVRQNLAKDEVLKAEDNLRIIENIAPRSGTAIELRLKLQTAKDQTKAVATLLRDGDRDFQANRLTQPDGDNALEKYRQVLQIDPLNQDAKRGLQKIFEYYAKAAEQQVADGNVDKAEAIIEKMDLVQAGSLEAEQLRKRLGRLSDSNARIDQLLRRAKSASRAGRYTQPNGNNALSYYQQVLKLDPDNRRASYGIEEIIDHYKQQFNQSLDRGKFTQAEKAVNTLDYILPNSSMVVGMYKRLQAAKPPPKPEIEIISDIVSQFKSSMESSNVKKVKTLSEFEAGREQFVDQFFANYQSFKINVSGFQYIANDHRATAQVNLSRLINKKGHAVQPGAWGDFTIVVRKNKDDQWRVYW
ncbi:MAG: protein kinase [Gammaproteobacteria bacterium]|nr:protein kinase [Gammaproteobacteria bacterium]